MKLNPYLLRSTIVAALGGFWSIKEAAPIGAMSQGQSAISPALRPHASKS